MLITATNSTPPAQSAAPEVAKNEAKPRRATDTAPRATNDAPRESADSSRSQSQSQPQSRPQSPPPGKGSEYRLVYDKEFSRTFVQVVDRDSGEEILRFPPEQLIRFIDKTIGRDPARGTAGLLVDRSV